MKVCSKCGESKPFDSYFKRAKSNDGLVPHCKSCSAIKRKIYYQSHREEILNKKKDYHVKKSESIAKYRKENADKYRELNKKWRSENKDHILSKRTERLKNDLNFKIAFNLRSRLRSALKNNQKTGSAVKDLGCSIEDFKIYLESNFSEGMSWENYGLGNGKWNMDHVVPLSKFNLLDLDEFRKACHYTNIRPIWSIENSRKGNRL